MNQVGISIESLLAFQRHRAAIAAVSGGTLPPLPPPPHSGSQLLPNQNQSQQGPPFYSQLSPNLILGKCSNSATTSIQTKPCQSDDRLQARQENRDISREMMDDINVHKRKLSSPDDDAISDHSDLEDSKYQAVRSQY